MLGLTAALLFMASATGCGKSSPSRTPQPDAVPTRLAFICKNAARELQSIDQHSLGSDPYLINSVIGHAANKAEAVENSASASLRRLPNTPETAAALSALARSGAQLRAVVYTLRHQGAGHSGYWRGMLLRFLRASSGCGTVSLRNPTGG